MYLLPVMPPKIAQIYVGGGVVGGITNIKLKKSVKEGRGHGIVKRIIDTNCQTNFCDIYFCIYVLSRGGNRDICILIIILKRRPRKRKISGFCTIYFICVSWKLFPQLPVLSMWDSANCRSYFHETSSCCTLFLITL